MLLLPNEVYTELFLDSFFASLLYPFDRELLFIVMLSFGGYDTVKIIIFSFLGNMSGALINFSVGKLIYSSRGRASLKVEDEEKLQKASAVFQKYGVWVLLLSWNSIFGSVITFLAGLFNIRCWVFIALVSLGKAYYYISYLVEEGVF